MSFLHPEPSQPVPDADLSYEFALNMRKIECPGICRYEKPPDW
jgi:hypothetical protein